MLPLWAVLAVMASLAATAIPLTQERFKADGYALALWNKVVECTLFLPFILYVGLPDDPKFYLYTFITAVLYSISDVIYFRAIPVVGSGLMTRLLPSSVLATFVLWFAVAPEQIQHYLAQPAKTMAILAIFGLFVGAGFFVKRCAVSWAGIKIMWPVIFFASIGPLFSKLALTHVASSDAGFVESLRAPISYLFVQALMMVTALIGFHALKKPMPTAVLLNGHNIRTAMVMGIIMSLILVLKTKAVELADNPGLVSLIFFTDALWVMLVYKLTGRRENSNIWAGLGIVISAALLVWVKSMP